MAISIRDDGCSLHVVIVPCLLIVFRLFDVADRQLPTMLMIDVMLRLFLGGRYDLHRLRLIDSVILVDVLSDRRWLINTLLLQNTIRIDLHALCVNNFSLR